MFGLNSITFRFFTFYEETCSLRSAVCGLPFVLVAGPRCVSVPGANQTKPTRGATDGLGDAASRCRDACGAAMVSVSRFPRGAAPRAGRGSRASRPRRVPLSDTTRHLARSTAARSPALAGRGDHTERQRQPTWATYLFIHHDTGACPAGRCEARRWGSVNE